MATFRRDLSILEGTPSFDIVIIGGGISGAWLALHCAQQGHSTILVEKHDFSSQTSSSSSKLLHGGIRYLQQMQFGKVRESALERAHYMYSAAHLSKSVPFVVPTYRDFKRSKFFLNCGMLAYQTLCLGENRLIGDDELALPPSKSISAKQLNSIYDLSNHDHTGAVVFHERHMLDTERMVLSILKTAENLGARSLNYVSAEHFNGDSSCVEGVELKDQLNGETYSVKSKLVINAAGPWIDNLNAQLTNHKKAPSINGFAVGSHIITRKLCDHAIALTTSHQSDAKIDRGGRHVFVIPWRGFSLIGTSYDETDSPNNLIELEANHVEQLLSAVNEGMPSAKLTRADIVSGYSGLYPLNTNNIKSTVYQGSGEYQIIDHAKSNGVDGIITALGAKFTTGRKLSELTMRLVSERLGKTGSIKKTKLSESRYTSLSAFEREKIEQHKNTFSADTIKHFIAHYGSDIDAFIASLNELEMLQPVCQHQLDVMGQINWAISQEKAMTLSDALFGRTSLGLLGIKEDDVHKVAQYMSPLLGWNDEETGRQINCVLSRLQRIDSAISAQSVHRK